MPRKTVRKSLTSPEKLALINSDNMRLKDDFLDYLKSLRRSPGTLAGYDNDLNIIFTYVMERLNNKDFRKLTKRDIISIQNWLVDNGNSPARIRRIKSALSSLSNYCENILSDDDPDYSGYRAVVRKIENPPLQSVREKTVWDDVELEDILKLLVNKKKYEMACFVALGVYSGRRKAELCRFRMSDFEESRLVCDGALYKSAPIQTKGGKMLECYTLAHKFQPYLDAWISYRNEIGIESDWLFPERNNWSEHIQISTVNSWANTLSTISGRDFYFHSLRHAFCSALIRAGIPDSVIVDIVGWSSSEMLKIYDDNPKDDRLGMYFTKDGIVASQAKSFSDM